MTVPAYRRSGKCWFVGDGLIHDVHAFEHRASGGRPLECSSKLLIHNPQANKFAAVTVRFYHLDVDPTELKLRVAPGRIESVELSTLPQVPHNRPFWITVDSDIPVLPQARHADFTFWQQTPDALGAVTPYPGPLRDETHWLFPDCFQGGAKSWHEHETLTILNPAGRAVDVVLTYRLRGKAPHAQEKITIPPQRVAALNMWQRHGRIVGRARPASLKLEGDYAIQLEATSPIIAHITRRARWRDFPSIVGSRSVIAHPLAADACAGQWLYPGGLIVDRGIRPLGQNFDVTWTLLFIHNLHPRKSAQPRLTFHDAQGTTTRAKPAAVRPRDASLQWLHLEPYLGKHTRLDDPFALIVESDTPVLPAVTNAEFEMFSQMCPGAMGAVNLYPGPLTTEKTWWLGIGPAGGSDDHEAQWQQIYHLFNPGHKPADVTLSFFDGSDRRAAPGRAPVHPPTHALTVPPHAVACVCSDDLSCLPVHRDVAVRADSTRPICAQTTVRAFTRRLAPTRSMYANIGLPMKLAHKS